MSSTSRGRPPRPQRLPHVYDGTMMAGFVIVRGQRFHVFSADGEPIGMFDDLRSAVRAAPPAAESQHRFPEIHDARPVEEKADPCTDRPFNINSVARGK